MMLRRVRSPSETGANEPGVVSTHRRHLRTALGVLAILTGVGWSVLIAALALREHDAAAHEMLAGAAWACGIATVLLAVSVLQERVHPDDHPRHLQTITSGLVAEWRR